MFHKKEFETLSYLSEDHLYRSFKPRDLRERMKSAIKFMLFGIFGLVIHFLYTHTLQITAKFKLVASDLSKKSFLNFWRGYNFIQRLNGRIKFN